MMKEKIEKTLNYFLSFDSESADRLKKLENKVLQIELIDFKKSFQLYFINNKIQINTTHFLPPHVSIKGTVILFLHLSLTKNRQKLLTDLEITGDTLLAQAVIDLFDTMDIDWEEYLSHYLGDAPSYQIGQFARKVKKVRKKFQQSFTQQINEYIHEEIKLFPAKSALSDFFADIDELRLEADRLTAKIEYLMNTFVKESLP